MKQTNKTNETTLVDLHIKVQYSTDATNVVVATKNDLITRECKKNIELINIGIVC
jgi:hypothetical protein